MTSKPISYNAPMVRALLDGSKTQTRRIFAPDKMTWSADGRYTTHVRRNGELIETGSGPFIPDDWLHYCPFGHTGDQIWVRETFCPILPQDPHYNGGQPIGYDYAATYTHGFRLGDSLGIKKVWTPSIHMPRAASRITLEITDVRVERLGDITREDAMAEGVELRRVSESDHRWIDYTDKEGRRTFGDPRRGFWSLWESIYGPESGKADPWVWVIEFTRVKP